VPQAILADVNVQSEKGETPLHLATVNGHLEVVRVLLKHGANTNLRDTEGKTPLHRARSEGHLDIVSFLLSDIYKQDHKGGAPVQSAVTIKPHEDKQLPVEHEAAGQGVGLLWTLARWVGGQLSWYPRV
jgi:hypothetical protein